jgi:DNA-binding transcriptional ArsR family regulator
MDVFTALAEPTRRNILEMLASRGQLSATDISDKFKVSPPAISQHLKVLREANLVQMEKHAQQRLYQLNPDAFSELEEWVKRVTELWNERFDALEALLNEEKKKTLKNTKER